MKKKVSGIAAVLAIAVFSASVSTAFAAQPAVARNVAALASSGGATVNSGCGDDEDQPTKVSDGSSPARYQSNKVVESDQPPTTNCITVIVPGTGEGGGGGGGIGGIDYPGGEPGGGSGGDGSGGGAAGGSPVDQSMGSSMDFNRQPSCPKEADFLAQQIAYMQLYDAPIGRMLPLVLTDPYFQDPGWTKWETSVIQRDWTRVNPGFVREYKIVMHYMYNVTSGQIFQTKLKNSFQYGCQGIVKTN